MMTNLEMELKIRELELKIMKLELALNRASTSSGSSLPQDVESLRDLLMEELTMCHATEKISNRRDTMESALRVIYCERSVDRLKRAVVCLRAYEKGKMTNWGALEDVLQSIIY